MLRLHVTKNSHNLIQVQISQYYIETALRAIWTGMCTSSLCLLGRGKRWKGGGGCVKVHCFFVLFVFFASDGRVRMCVGDGACLCDTGVCFPFCMHTSHVT